MDGRDGEVATIGARPQPAPETTATARRPHITNCATWIATARQMSHPVHDEARIRGRIQKLREIGQVGFDEPPRLEHLLQGHDR